MMRKLFLLSILLIGTLTSRAQVLSESDNPYKFANLVVFVKFADQADNEWDNSKEYYEKLFNDNSEDANSVRRYFLDQSFGRFDWVSTFAPVEYIDSHTRNYFQPKSDSNPEGYGSNESQTGSRFKQLIKDMCAFLEDKLPEDVNLDCDDNNIIDNIVIIINGRSDLGASYQLWPMNAQGADGRIRGLKSGKFLRVFDEANGFSSLKPIPLNTGVLCHEMMHTLGAPDLYTSSSVKTEPVNVWDLMSDNLVRPQGFTAYTRQRWSQMRGSWIREKEFTLLDKEGTYSLRPLSYPLAETEGSENVVYKIQPDPSKSQYFLVEYRDRRDPWDAGLPASGLLVYRIDKNIVDFGNIIYPNGFYIFRPGGSTTAAGNIKNAPLGSDTGRYSFGTEEDTDFPYYTDGTRAPFAISEVTENDGNISFRLTFPQTGSAVTEIGIDQANEGNPVIYNLQGIRLQRITTPGLYIINGKKHLVF